MSGGSYNYFYAKAGEEVSRMAGTIEDMAKQLERGPHEGYGERPPDEAQVLMQCATYLRAISWKLRCAARLLSAWEEVFHDIEWWESNDSGPDEVVASFRKLLAGRVPR